VTTPVPAPVSPLVRALDEALGSVAAPAQARAILHGALLRAGLDAPPADPEMLFGFVEHALLGSVEQALGRDAAELVGVQIEQMLRMVAPTVVLRRRPTGTGDDADELSGERIVDAPPHPAHVKSSDVRRPLLPRADVAAALRPPRSEMPTPEEIAPLQAPVLFASRWKANQSGTQRKDPTARSTRLDRDDPSTPRGGVAEVRGPLARSTTMPIEILVVTLDEQLPTDLERAIGTRGRVTAIRSLDVLVRALTVGAPRFVVLIDAALPSIDVPTLARHASALPPSARVLLWGMDERQRARIVLQFPNAASWLSTMELPTAESLLSD